MSGPESSSSVPLESVQRLDPAHEAPVDSTLPLEGTLADDGPLAHGQESASEGPRDVPRPIGPSRLRALRQAIESGAFPTEEDISSGLERMFTMPPEESEGRDA